MRVNERKVPIKYILNVFKEMDHFPTHEDKMYVILSNLSDKEIIDKPFTASTVWSYVKDVFGTIKDLNDFLDYASNQEVCPGFFLEKQTAQKEKTKENFYTVIKNPWS